MKNATILRMKALETKFDEIATDLKGLRKTVNSLVRKMDKIFERMEVGFNQTKVDIEDLAAMTAREFNAIRSEATENKLGLISS